MNDENRPQQVPANADGNLRETHDDESALHSEWGSDGSICESIGDGLPRDDHDERRATKATLVGLSTAETEADAAVRTRRAGGVSELPSPTPQPLPVAIATVIDDMAKTIVARATLRAKCAIQKATLRGEHSWLGK